MHIYEKKIFSNTYKVPGIYRIYSLKPWSSQFVFLKKGVYSTPMTKPKRIPRSWITTQKSDFYFWVGLLGFFPDSIPVPYECFTIKILCWKIDLNHNFCGFICGCGISNVTFFIWFHECNFPLLLFVYVSVVFRGFNPYQNPSVPRILQYRLFSGELKIGIVRRQESGFIHKDQNLSIGGFCYHVSTGSLDSSTVSQCMLSLCSPRDWVLVPRASMQHGLARSALKWSMH